MDNNRCNYPLLTEIAARLKELRQERGLSQRLVYIDTDVHVGKIELGKTNVSVSTLAILCKYYGITLEEFFRGISTH